MVAKEGRPPQAPGAPLRLFCNKLQDDVPKLIAGPRVFICDECVKVCNDILADDRRFENQAVKKPSERTDDRLMPWPKDMLHCALCRVAIPVKAGFVVEGNRGILCADCVKAVRAASASGR